MIGLSFSGCDRIAAIVFLTLAVSSHGAVTTGPLASIVDISPNYASKRAFVFRGLQKCVSKFMFQAKFRIRNHRKRWKILTEV